MANWGRCPKCGYEGHNKVYHWGLEKIECDECGYDYTRKEEAEAKKKGEKMSIFSWQKDMWNEKSKEKEQEKKTDLLGELMISQFRRDIERREKEKERENMLQRAERERPNREISLFSKKHVVYQDNRRVIVINNPIINNYYGDERD